MGPKETQQGRRYLIPALVNEAYCHLKLGDPTATLKIVDEALQKGGGGNAVMAKGDLVIAVSDYIAGHVANTYEINPHRLRTIPRGVDTSAFHPDRVGSKRVKTLVQDWSVASDMPVIVLPGRVSRIKGHHVLIDAIARLGREDLTVLMVGDAEDKHGCKRVIEC